MAGAKCAGEGIADPRNDTGVNLPGGLPESRDALGRHYGLLVVLCSLVNAGNGGGGVRRIQIQPSAAPSTFVWKSCGLGRSITRYGLTLSGQIPLRMWGEMLDAPIVKPKGRHPEKQLTSLKVGRLAEAGRYADGNGLYLIVDPSVAKRWMLRTIVQGKRRDIGLGGVSLVSLAEAREQAHAMRKLAREGGNPLIARHHARQIIPSFEEAVRRVHESRAGVWRNEKHKAQWINTVRDYAFPMLGPKRIDLIETADILLVLTPIWTTKPETARRLRQRLSTVMDWAKASGFRTGDNPVDGVTKGLPRQNGRSEHHEAIPYAEMPTFLERLRHLEMSPIARLAFEFLILTACRTNEVLGACWQEFDLEKAIWDIPATRMKGKRRHAVPLSRRCLEILREAKAFAGMSELVFPGRTFAKPLSNMVFLMTMRRMQLSAVPHGFRSSFRDWKTLVQLGEQLCSTPEEFKAWSQNLGHEQVMTTFRSYGSVQQSRQGELIRKLGQPKVSNTELRSKLQDLLAAAFRNGDRHVTAKMLHAEALGKNISVSVATVYNTLNHFAGAGLLREVAVEGSKAYFHTKITDHQHFYYEHDGRLIGLGPDEEVAVNVHKLPEGMKVARIDVLIRLVPDK